MNTNDPRFEIIRRCRDGEATAEEFARLEANLREDREFRETYVRYMNLDVALSAVANLVPFPETISAVPNPRRNVGITWRPLTAAAAGIVFGMLCTSVVFGFVAQRMGTVKKMPLMLYNPGLEVAATIMAEGLPNVAGQWGADSAVVVKAENGVQPLEGSQMLRLEPIAPEKNRLSRAYQVLDLRSQPGAGAAADAEVLVTASFFAAKGDVASRFMIRAFALKETPAQATKGFWPKTEDDGVVSMRRTFETAAGDRGWHTFSMKMPLPRGAKSLVFVLGAGTVDDAPLGAQAHYLDDVQVSILTPQSAQP